MNESCTCGSAPTESAKPAQETVFADVSYVIYKDLKDKYDNLAQQLKVTEEDRDEKAAMLLAAIAIVAEKGSPELIAEFAAKGLNAFKNCVNQEV